MEICNTLSVHSVGMFVFFMPYLKFVGFFCKLWFSTMKAYLRYVYIVTMRFIEADDRW
jgi:hypothetical protein